jgi:hypothetical protein
MSGACITCALAFNDNVITTTANMHLAKRVMSYSMRIRAVDNELPKDQCGTMSVRSRKIAVVFVDYGGGQPKRLGIIAINRWQSIT